MSIIIACTGIAALCAAFAKWRSSGRKTPFASIAVLYGAALFIDVWSALDLPLPSVARWISQMSRPIADTVYGWLK
ncbi:hypothetical protein ACFPPD_12815 [Cohnella suwonensis]|uniref:Uncharacterized protein n=1 Tax=Cohnella suwonensis TaxID=696072 RepID=A0ABW0LV61_9BACL